jgi:hypothetical protein
VAEGARSQRRRVGAGAVDPWWGGLILPRACIRCGEDAVPGRSRCQKHDGGAWARQLAGRQQQYREPIYLKNRRLVIRREPTCHWQLPRCTHISTQADH